MFSTTNFSNTHSTGRNVSDCQMNSTETCFRLKILNRKIVKAIARLASQNDLRCRQYYSSQKKLTHQFSMVEMTSSNCSETYSTLCLKSRLN